MHPCLESNSLLIVRDTLFLLALTKTYATRFSRSSRSCSLGSRHDIQGQMDERIAITVVAAAVGAG
jgi:hypothetical protein